MANPVVDTRSNHNDNIETVVKVLGQSRDRLKVFEAIYHGKKSAKTVEEIHRRTKLERKRVLEEGKKLANHQVVTQTRKDNDTAYEKDSFIHSNKKKILSLVRNPAGLAKLPTKTRPAGARAGKISITVPKSWVSTKQITIDEIDSFKAARRVGFGPFTPHKIPEKKFKEGIRSILKTQSSEKDWGGETNDLWTTRLRIRGRRISAAFAFKGPGKSGKLTPGKMGKNGDQIQRLFRSSAEVLFVQYWSEIDQSVVDQMSELAKAKSVSEGKKIYFGIIDGDDSARLLIAFPKHFGVKASKIIGKGK